MSPIATVLIVVGVVFLIVVARSLKIVTQFEKGLVERFGRFDRMVDPGLRIIVHHAGAMVPFFAGRIRSFYSSPSNLVNMGLDPKVERPFLDQFRDFYVDAWTNGSLAALMTSYEIFGADRMVFGSDMPFGAEMGRSFVREAVHTVERMMIPPTEREKIWSGNIRRLCGLERP